MIKLALLGSDSTHGTHFAKLAHPLTGQFKSVRFTHIFGLDEAATKEMAAVGDIPNIVCDPSEMLDKVDGAVLVFRHGDLHMEYALPFIARKIPIWVDKPFAINPSDARLMLDTAKTHGTLITGGSTYKSSKFIPHIKKELASGRLGDIYSVAIDYNIFPNSPYGGFHFYAAHLIEMCCELFGYDMRSVATMQTDKNILVKATFEDMQVFLNYTQFCYGHFAVVIGSKESISVPVDRIEDTYHAAFGEFEKMIRSGKMPFDPENLYKVTIITNAIEKSMSTGKEVMLHLPL